MEEKNKNKRLTEFDRMVNDVMEKHSKRLNALLVTMDDEDFPINYFKILEYVSPKLMRSEVIEPEREQIITVVHVNREKPTPEAEGSENKEIV